MPSVLICRGATLGIGLLMTCKICDDNCNLCDGTLQDTGHGMASAHAIASALNIASNWNDRKKLQAVAKAAGGRHLLEILWQQLGRRALQRAHEEQYQHNGRSYCQDHHVTCHTLLRGLGHSRTLLTENPTTSR